MPLVSVVVATYNRSAVLRHALRSALRQDPDVSLVGEMRDMETIETALHDSAPHLRRPKTSNAAGEAQFFDLDMGDGSDALDRSPCPKLLWQ